MEVKYQRVRIRTHCWTWTLTINVTLPRRQDTLTQESDTLDGNRLLLIIDLIQISFLWVHCRHLLTSWLNTLSMGMSPLYGYCESLHSTFITYILFFLSQKKKKRNQPQSNSFSSIKKPMKIFILTSTRLSRGTHTRFSRFDNSIIIILSKIKSETLSTWLPCFRYHSFRRPQNNAIVRWHVHK